MSSPLGYAHVARMVIVSALFHRFRWFKARRLDAICRTHAWHSVNEVIRPCIRKVTPYKRPVGTEEQRLSRNDAMSIRPRFCYYLYSYYTTVEYSQCVYTQKGSQNTPPYIVWGRTQQYSLLWGERKMRMHWVLREILHIKRTKYW